MTIGSRQRRKVTASGVIWVQGHAYYVSRRLAGQVIPIEIVDGRLTIDHDTAQILTGAITVALLSIATELSLGGLEHAVTPAGLRVRRGGPAPPRLSAADQVTEVA